jgi:pimeloyl-ACP methyl ester carboxylesterase
MARNAGNPNQEPFPHNEGGVTARELVVDGERVRVVESGDEGAFPIVLLHGWGASAYNYRAVMGPLAKAGFRAIAPDLRGHGWSETQCPRDAWTVASMAEWVSRLLDALGVSRCVLVGQSIGGAVAFDAGIRMPERVAALVLLAPIGFTPVRRVLLARGLRWLRPPATPRWAVSFVLRRIYGTRGRWSAKDLDEYWRPLRRSDVVKAILQSACEFDFMPRDPAAVPIAVRNVVIRFGELDRLIPWQAAMRHAQRFTAVDAAVMPGVGHVPAEEVPNEVVELIQRAASAVGSVPLGPEA